MESTGVDATAVSELRGSRYAIRRGEPYTGFALNVTRGPAIRGAVGAERSALMAEAAVPQVRRTTPQAAAYWAAAAFNGRHHERRCGHWQPAAT